MYKSIQIYKPIMSQIEGKINKIMNAYDMENYWKAQNMSRLGKFLVEVPLALASSYFDSLPRVRGNSARNLLYIYIYNY